MTYNISSPSAPKMPTLGKGTECIKLLLTQASKDMHQSLVPMLFPVLGAHISGSEFQYPDLSWKEMCGMMANLIAESGGNKGQLGMLVEAICRDFRTHDEVELDKLVAWQKLYKSKGGSKDKPTRPDVAFWFPPSDVTNPAYLQNAMACEMQGDRTQYLNLPEVEMADRMCGGHKQVSQMIRNIYDRQRAGALRATADGVTGNPYIYYDANNVRKARISTLLRDCLPAGRELPYVQLVEEIERLLGNKLWAEKILASIVQRGGLASRTDERGALLYRMHGA